MDLSARESLELGRARNKPERPEMKRRPITNHRARTAKATTHLTRDLEWGLAWIMMAWALVLACPGDSLSGPSFRAFHAYPWMTEAFWATCFGTIAGLRLFALYVNGRAPARSPWGRMIGAAAGVICWTVIAILVFKSGWTEFHSISPGVAVYGSFVGFELRSLLRASYDAGYSARG